MDSGKEKKQSDQTQQMTVTKGIGIYLALLGGFVALVKVALAFNWIPAAVPLAVYFAFGFILNRLVLRELIEWHPMYNTIENVSRAKLNMFALWPVAYPRLFFKIVVNKHL